MPLYKGTKPDEFSQWTSEYVVGWLGFMAYQPLYVVKRQIHFYDYLSVLFQTIQFSMSAPFNSKKHFYFRLFSLVKQF